MLKRLIRVALMALALFTGVACSTAGAIDPAKPTVASGDVLFTDAFQDTASGWTTWDQNLSAVTYQDGGLRIQVDEANYDYWSRPGKRFADSRVEVDATKTDGPDNNDYGLICRYRNGDHFYAFLISSDGYYGIMRVVEGQYQLISGAELGYSERIRQGKATNRLRGDCVGNTLTLYVNDEKLVEAQDDTFQSGEVGLFAGAYDEPGVTILFDNFIVSKP